MTADVIVVGAGPSGLAAATRLKEKGIGRVTVLDRETEAGGTPRHCGHFPFGWREFSRILRGPDYARRLRRYALESGVEILTGTSVIKLMRGPRLLTTGPDGTEERPAKRIILCTGARETPRSARFVGGSRPAGVMNTGTLQAMIYLKGQRPFKRPAIVGTELVAFSAILTCRHAKIQPAAMIESQSRPTAFYGSQALPRALGIPLYFNTSVDSIHGGEQVEAVSLRTPSGIKQIEADGIVLTGQFVPEATLIRSSHLALDPNTGGPIIDQNGACSDPDYFAAGNLLRPVETAGWSWQEGRDVADSVIRSISATSHSNPTIQIIKVHDALQFVVPQKISLPVKERTMIQARVSRPIHGALLVKGGADTRLRQSLTARPEQRILVPISAQMLREGEDLSITIEEET